MAGQVRTTMFAPLGLLYVLLSILASLQTAFAYPQEVIIGNDATADSISGNPTATAPTDDSSPSANDDADSDTMGIIGNQSFGVQFGGGFVVGCIIGVLGYILYRIMANCFRRRRPRRRDRVGGGTRGSQVGNEPEVGVP